MTTNNYLRVSYRDRTETERPRYPVTVADVFPFDDANAESTRRAKEAAEKRANSIEGATICMWRGPRKALVPVGFRLVGEGL